MLTMQRIMGRQLGLMFSLRNSSQVASIAARAASDSKKPEVEAAKKDFTSGVGTKSSGLVAAAFQALKEDQVTDEAGKVPTDKLEKPSLLDEMIINAKTVNGLLMISESGNGVLSRRHALKIVSILAEWSSINKVKLSDFESDPRFIKVCRLLGRTNGPTKGNGNTNKAAVNAQKKENSRTDDLNMVLGITGDDEAAKLVTSITVPQMVKVMSNLALKKRRSITLLRAIAYNISGNSHQLDLKQSSDLLYAMASLNFPDPVLTDRICTDVQALLPDLVDKSAVVGSILTSLGLLRYRDTAMLESLAGWVLQNHTKCRPQDILALFHTCAILNYPTQQLDAIKEKLVKNLQQADLIKALDWINYVWSLVVLDLAASHHIDSVLKREFLEKLIEERKGVVTPTIKMKLLNINAAAKYLLPNYTETVLSDSSSVFEIPLAHSKEKQLLVNGLLDALKSLVSLDNYVKSGVDSRMGFLIDAEFYLDKKIRPVKSDQANNDTIRLAILVQDYHDWCQGINSCVNGVSALSCRLLEKAGYTVLAVPYTEFSVSEKLLKRVQYLEGKIKEIVKTKG